MDKAKNTGPLPLPSVLRDLAIIRACELELGSVVDGHAAVGAVVERSYEYVQSARTAVGMQGRGAADDEGTRVEALRTSMEELLGRLED
ncbi:hypothetical protein APHAL10511_000101 [Amanita phalloides]|nr:hypothetical protein APHAL10511_000101 [Amanita phalloides]